MQTADAAADAVELEKLRAMLPLSKTPSVIQKQIDTIQAKYAAKATNFKPRSVAVKKGAAAAPLTARHRKIRGRLGQRGRRAAEPTVEAVIPRNIIHIVLKDKKWVALPPATYRVGKDKPLPITVTPVAAGAAGSGPIFTIIDGTVAAASSSSSTDIALDAQQKANFDKGVQQPVAQFDARIAALALEPRIAELGEADRTLWSRLVLIAGFDPYVAMRIVCDGAHDYGSLINGFYTRFLVGTVFTALNGPPPGRRPLINVGGVLDLVLTPQSDKGGGFNAKPEVIATQLEELNPLEGVAVPEPLEQCLVGSGMRNGPDGANCASVCALACSFGSTGMLPDSITFNLLPHYVQAANQQSVRAFWAQSMPQFMDAAGTPTEDAVALYGAKFVDLTRATLGSPTFDCNVAPFREFSAPGAQESFTVYNFYGDSKHIFRRGAPIPAGEHRAKVGAEGCSLEIFYQGALIATIYAKQSISLNGLSDAVTAMMGRGKSKKTKDPISIQYTNNQANPSDADKAQVMMAKQLLDWAQAYFIAFLWHNFGLIFTLVTNDTFLLRIAKWLRLPFVLLMSKNGAKLYCFDPRAMVLDENEKQTIIGNINAFTDARAAELFVEIDQQMNRIFTHNNDGTAVPIIGCLFSRVLELKRKIRETVAAIAAARGAAAAEQENIAKQFRYLIKQDVYTYLLSKFKDDIEILFSSAISVTRSINSLIAAQTKQEPVVTMSDTLTSIINTMKTFMTSLNPSQIAAWLTKLPFPIVVSRAELQKKMFAALIARAAQVDEGAAFAELTTFIKNLNRDSVPFTADEIVGRFPAPGPDVPPDAIAIANEFRRFTAIDWSLSTSGEPAYPYYFLMDNDGGYRHPECPVLPAGPNLALTPANYAELSIKQQERVRALGYTEAALNGLQIPTLFSSSDASQKILKRMADSIGGIVIAPAPAPALAGGRRRQRGGAYNDNFKNITVWDKNNFDYAGLLTRILDEKITYSIGGAAAVAATPPHPFLDSTVITGGARSPIATYFYNTEAYLNYCFDYVEESNNDILNADYVNMLLTLSELRQRCFMAELQEENLLIELACILLIEDDAFPSVYSTIQYNRGFDKGFLYTPLRGLLAGLPRTEEIVDLLAIFDEGGPVADAAPPSVEEIFAESDNLISRMYKVDPDRTLRDILEATADRKWRSAEAAIASERYPAVAAGGAGSPASPIPVKSSMEREYDDVIDSIRRAHDELFDLEKAGQSMVTPDKEAEKRRLEKIYDLRKIIAGLEERSTILQREIEAVAVAKGPGAKPRKGGFRRARSRIGKKRTTRKAAASSKSRRTRRRK